MGIYTELRDQILADMKSGDYRVKSFTVDGVTVENPSFSELKAMLEYVTMKAQTEQSGVVGRTRAVSLHGRCGR